MSISSLNLLVISDFHFTPGDDPAHTVCGQRHTALGPILLRKALLRLKHMGVRLDLLVLLGDMLDDGTAPDADRALSLLADEAGRAGVPVIAVPGNHDHDPDMVARIFSCAPGLHEIGGYGFMVFHDRVGEADVTTRLDADLELPGKVAAAHPDLKLVALQHNPIYPLIESSGYPYMPTNVQAIQESYAAAGVVLSLSGHYHPGQCHACLNGVAYHTVKAVSESPFNFSLVRLAGCEVEIEELGLRHEQPGLIDVHCHTEYAYCAEDVSAINNVAYARIFGLESVCLAEHAFHLYFEREDAWSFRWQDDPDLARQALEGPRSRMREYREYVEALRGDGVLLGLEVDLCAGGGLLLAEEDKHGWDMLVGAVHNVSGSKGATQSWAEGAFLDATAGILEQPIQVLAHPFRWFGRAGFRRPAKLYERVADMLASAGVAAEINFHTNAPDPVFLRACHERGVRLVFGTDSHNLAEVGELYPHLRVLRTATECCSGPGTSVLLK